MKSTTRTELLASGALPRPRCLFWSARVQFPLVLLLCFAFGCTGQAGLKVYFLRHAEAGHNVIDQWESKPREEWPPYVGDPDVFTPTGKQQVAACTKKLKKHHFDFIAVSPTWRTRNTVAPYLRETDQKAELWPELLEFGSLDQQHDFVSLPPPSADLFTGAVIRLSESDAGIFTLREDGRRLFHLGHTPAQKAADRWAVVQKDIDLIQKRFGGSDKSVLLVSHGNIGSLLLQALTGEKLQLKTTLLNTSLWMAEQQPDGCFKLRMLNDQPVR